MYGRYEVELAPWYQGRRASGNRSSVPVVPVSTAAETN